MARTTTDHKTIRDWAEARGGHPARVKGTGAADDAALRLLGHPVVLREPPSEVRHPAPLAAEGLPRRVDGLAAAVHAEGFGLRQTRPLYQWVGNSRKIQPPMADAQSRAPPAFAKATAEAPS